MAVELAAAYVNLVPSARGIAAGLGKELTGPLERSARDAGSSASKQFGGRFSEGLKSVARIASGVLIAKAVRGSVVGLTHEIGDFIAQARESVKVGRLTDAVIRSTGGAAGLTGKQFADLATRLSNLSGVDDEVVQSGENVLATFTNVKNQVGAGNNVFDRATEAALNMSSALGQDMQSSVIQLGKALNDPIKGITALQRVGVSFTQQQRDQIKALVDSGKTLEAQKIILGELDKEFGGAAAAAADPLARLQVIIGNFKEQTAGALLPVLGQVANVLGFVLPAAADALTPVIANVAPALATAFGAIIPALAPVLALVSKIIGPILEQLGSVIADTFTALRPAVEAVLPVLGNIAGAFITVVNAALPIVGVFGQLIASVAPILNTLARAAITIVTAAAPLVELFVRLASTILGALMPVLPPIIAAFEQVATILAGAIASALQALIPAVSDLLNALLPVLPTVSQLAVTLVQQLAPVLPQLAQSFAQLLVALAPLIPQLVELAATLIDRIGVPTIVAIATAFANLASAIAPLISNTHVLTPLVFGLAGAFAAVKGVQALQNGIIGIARAGGTAVGTVQRLAGNVGKFVTAVKGAPGQIASFASSLADVAKSAGAAIINLAKTVGAFIAEKAAAVASATATGLLTAAQWLLNAAMEANPIVLAVTAIALLAAGIFIAYKKFKPFRDVVDAVFGALKTAFGWIKDHWPLVLGLLIAPFIVGPILIFKAFGPKLLELLGKIPGLLVGVGVAILKGLATGITKGIELVAIVAIGIPLLLLKLLIQGAIILVQAGVKLVAQLVARLVLCVAPRQDHRVHRQPRDDARTESVRAPRRVRARATTSRARGRAVLSRARAARARLDRQPRHDAHTEGARAPRRPRDRARTKAARHHQFLCVAARKSARLDRQPRANVVLEGHRPARRIPARARPKRARPLLIRRRAARQDHRLARRPRLDPLQRRQRHSARAPQRLERRGRRRRRFHQGSRRRPDQEFRYAPVRHRLAVEMGARHGRQKHHRRPRDRAHRLAARRSGRRGRDRSDTTFALDAVHDHADRRIDGERGRRHRVRSVELDDNRGHNDRRADRAREANAPDGQYRHDQSARRRGRRTRDRREAAARISALDALANGGDSDRPPLLGRRRRHAHRI
jgi:phage-related protein